MPVLLTEKQFDLWISREAVVEYFKPAPNYFPKNGRCRRSLDLEERKVNVLMCEVRDRD
jgi:hypothetical protein